MICTSCSAPVKPIVAVDIDGTLGDYHGHFEKFASQWLCRARKEGVRDYDGRIKYREWFAEAYEIDVNTFRKIKLAYRQGGMKRSMPVDRDATAVLGGLQEDGVEIWLCTTRPYLKLDGIDPDTRFWLERHRIPFDHLLYGPNKYERLAEQVDADRVVAVVDDDLNHLMEAIHLGWFAVLLTNNYNRHVNNHSVIATSLWNAGQIVRIAMREWAKTNERNELQEVDVT